MKKQALIFQHVPFEGPGEIGSWLMKNDYELSVTRFYETPDSPLPGDIDLLVIMGGPMGIYDYAEYPWLKDEKRLIKEHIDAGTQVLGICLGAQLIADALGGKVTGNAKKEIGWFPVETVNIPAGISLPESFTAFHWHGDTFPLPDGAEHLFKSAACANQGFLYDNRVLALQFHLESNTESVGKLIDNCRKELAPDEYIHSEEQILQDTEKYSADSNRLLFALLDSCFGNN